MANQYLVDSPYSPFTIKNQFKAISNGKIYIGEVDKDPLNPSQQIQVYVVDETGSNVPVSQPIQLNAGGYLVYNGQVSKFITLEPYSMVVLNNVNAEMWRVDDISKVDPDNITASNVRDTTNGGSVQDFIDAQYTTVAELSTGKFKAGQYVRLSDRYFGLFLLQSGGTPDGAGILDAGNSNTAILQKTGRNILEEFGVVSGVDSTSKINAAFEFMAGDCVYGTYGAEYIHSSQLHLKGSLRALHSTFKPTGASMGSGLNAAIYSDVVGDIEVSVDGSSCPSLQYGVFVDAGINASNSSLNVNAMVDNITNSNDTQQCVGVCVFKSSSSTINQEITVNVNAVVNGVTATSNGSVGDNGGAARGILVAFNDSISTPNVGVTGTVRGVSSGGVDPSEDADGVQVFHGAYASGSSSAKFSVTGMKVSDSKKRGIKVQAQNCTVTNCDVDGDDCLAAFETYAVNTNFSNIRANNCTGIGVTTSASLTKISDASIHCIGTSAPIKLYDGADFCQISDSNVTRTATLPDNINYGQIEVQGSKFVSISNVTTNCTTFTGVGLLLVSGDLDTITVDHLVSINNGTSIVSIAATGALVIDGSSQLISSGGGILKTTNDDLHITMTGGDIRSGGIPVFTQSGSASGVVDLSNVKIETSGANDGILVSPESTLNNVTLKKTGAIATGYGVYGQNIKVAGCTVKNFDKGVDWSFSTTAEIYNNVAVGCNTPFNRTGGTAFVEHDNNFR